MILFSCPYFRVEVELSETRKEHIAERHPDLLPARANLIGETLLAADVVRISARMGTARQLSRWYADLLGGKHVVEAKLSFQYDREGDILYISKCAPYPEQASEELGDDVVARLNPKTNDIESLEILFFSTRLLRGDLFELPITADLRRSIN
jgi:hypothetical protein